jgi:hypothetical protein
MCRCRKHFDVLAVHTHTQNTQVSDGTKGARLSAVSTDRPLPNAPNAYIPLTLSIGTVHFLARRSSVAPMRVCSQGVSCTDRYQVLVTQPGTPSCGGTREGCL